MEHSSQAEISSSPVGDLDACPMTNRDVLLACKLWWAMFAISVVGNASGLFSLTGTPRVIGGVIGWIIGTAISVLIARWVVAKLKARRNWMRLFLTVFGVGGYLVVLVFWDFFVSAVFRFHNPVQSGAMLLAIVPHIWAIVMLNTPSSRAWFSGGGEKVEIRNAA